MSRKISSVKVDSELWRRAKKYCIDENLTLTEFLENTIREKIGEENERDGETGN